MRRVLYLFSTGIALLLLSLPLWAAVRMAECSYSSEQPGDAVCDRKVLYPMGDLALLVTLVGAMAVLVGCCWWFARRVRRPPTSAITPRSD